MRATHTFSPQLVVTLAATLCTTGEPCTHLLATYPPSEIAIPSTFPVCQTVKGISQGRPAYNDGPPKSLVDRDGVERYYCEYRPPGTSPSSKRAVLLFFHGSGGSAQDIYDNTSLRTKAISYNLSGGTAGFILIAIQARNLHWPVSTHKQDGSKFDTYHRDFSTNRDVSLVDQVIDTLVSSGVADKNRIFLSGWSNGARFAALYGIQRHGNPTAGGNRVAAVASYSGGDPYEDIDHGMSPSCKQSPDPVSSLPYYFISRSCDVMACDEAQASKLAADDGKPLPPGNILSTWVSNLNAITPNASWQLINDDGTKVGACALVNFCSMPRALLNHLHWPDGVADGSGNDREGDLLSFLANHPR